MSDLATLEERGLAELKACADEAALRDRRVKKRSFRRLWIARLNAACRARGMRYSELIAGLQRAMVALDRKSLSEIAIHDPDTFTKIVDLARANLPK